MQHPYLDFIIEKAKCLHGRIAVPDAQSDERVMRAAHYVHQNGWLDVVFTGSRAAYNCLADRLGLDISGIEIIDPAETTELDAYCHLYGRLRAKENLTPEQIETFMHEPAYFACMLHRHGKVDGICSGVYYSTADMARPAIKILGVRDGVRKMTAAGVGIWPHCPLGDNLVLSTGDGTIIPNPTAEELADIAILIAENAKDVLPEEPRVALISFSTLGSAQHAMVDKVATATRIAQEKRPDLAIDGEFQFDAALMPFVAAKKVKRPSQVAGRANVLIWPDLQSGNIAGKAMGIMGGGAGVGSTLLGIRGLVGDHSRGATYEEIISYIAFIGMQVHRPAPWSYPN